MLSPASQNRAVVWRPLVICPDGELSTRLLAAVRQMGVEPPYVLSEYPRRGAVKAMGGRSGCNVCFVDAATDFQPALEVISELAQAMPVIALHSRAEADLILRCMRLGSSDFLSEITTESVAGVLERQAKARLELPVHGPGSVLCVVPGKPGCGGSTLAVQLASHLAAGGTRPVLLVDGDPLTAGIAFLLKLKPEFHIQDVARDWSRMDEDLWSRLVVATGGMDVLAAPEDPAGRIELTPQFAAELCSFWRQRYGAIVIDMPDVRTALNCGFASLADTILLVATNELSALHATSRALRLLSSSGEQAKTRLILSRYTPATGLKCEDVKTALSVAPFAVLDNDYHALQTALIEGRPATGSRFAVSVGDLCCRLRGERPNVRTKRSLLSGMLRRAGRTAFSLNKASG